MPISKDPKARAKQIEQAKANAEAARLDKTQEGESRIIQIRVPADMARELDKQANISKFIRQAIRAALEPEAKPEAKPKARYTTEKQKLK